MIIYLHGFSSGAASYKAQALKALLSPIPFLVPEYLAHQPSVAVPSLIRYIENNVTAHRAPFVMLVGSSLGGYYARYLATVIEAVNSVVLINPALNPGDTLDVCLGQNTNMVTGEPFELTPDDLRNLRTYDVPRAGVLKPTLVLLDAGDEVIDYRVAETFYQDRGQVIVYPGGSHRFEHLNEAAREITAFYHKSSLAS